MEELMLARIQFASTTLFHFIFVPLSIGLAFTSGSHANAVCCKKERNLQKDDEILGHVFPYQLCCRGCNRYYSRISIWNELVRIIHDLWGMYLEHHWQLKLYLPFLLNQLLLVYGFLDGIS